MRRLATLLMVTPLLVTWSALAPFAAAARGDTPQGEDAAPVPPTAVSEGDAKKLVAAFDATLKSARREELASDRRGGEAAGLRVLAAGLHERIAKRLAEAAADERLLPETRTGALRALALQGEPGREQAGRVQKWLAEEAERDAEDLRKGRIGVPVDRNGDPVTGTPEARQALRLGESRAAVIAAGLATLRALDSTPKKAQELLEPFLQSPHDELAVAAVEAARAWNVRDLAPGLALLLRMYPRENRWETGAVTHIGGTNASAKGAWMTLFGHPHKQRARPALHRAVTACVSEWAGTAIADPESCDAWLATLR